MKEKRLFLTSLKQKCNEYLIKFSENQSAPKLENRKTSPRSPCAPNLLHVLVSWIPGYHNLCSPAANLNRLILNSYQVGNPAIWKGWWIVSETFNLERFLVLLNRNENPLLQHSKKRRAALLSSKLSKVEPLFFKLKWIISTI